MSKPKGKLVFSHKKDLEFSRCQKDPGWSKALESVPLADLRLVREAMKGKQEDKDKDKDERTWSDEKLRGMLVFNRWSNPICGSCGALPPRVGTLLRCSKCYLEMYCDKDCQKAHWRVHKLRCGQADGPLDKGYQAIAFAKVDPSPEAAKNVGCPASLILPLAAHGTRGEGAML